MSACAFWTCSQGLAVSASGSNEPACKPSHSASQSRSVKRCWQSTGRACTRGMGVVLRDLSRLGFDAEWEVISACAVGATHARRRVWIVAYPHSLYGRKGFWNTAAQQQWAVQASHSFAHSRTCQKARLADPSALYGGAHDVPFRMDRNRGYGNAVVPQIPEIIGRAILSL